MAALTLVVLSTLAGAPKSPRPELMVVPPTPVDVAAGRSLSAWKTVSSQLKRSRRRLKVSVKLQKKRRDFLVGPAREQARDCKDDLTCQIEIGTTLGADLLIVGELDATGLSLTAIDIRAETVIATVRSAEKLTKKSTKRKAKDAAKRLVNALVEAKKKSAAPPAVADVSPPAPEPSLPPPPALDPPPAPTLPEEGRIEVAAEHLAGVSVLEIDGAAVPFTGEGAAQWSGPAGEHTLVARHIDGRTATRTVVVEPERTIRVMLEFPVPLPAQGALAAAQSSATTSRNSDDSILGTWWFWTAIGTAVVAGSATAVVLASGDKGGPTLPDNRGIIQGTY